MAGKTKERILDAALDLFSQKGYEGTNLQEIADAVGIVKSALYRHFESKEELWNSLIDKMIEYYDKGFGTPDRLPDIPESSDELIDLTMHMVGFTVNDDKVIKMRKIILTEQFRDERVRSLATTHFNTGLETIFEKIFSKMMENGLIRQDDPEMLAFAFTTPISSLIHLCDREPDKKEETIGKIKAFTEHFVKTYFA